MGIYHVDRMVKLEMSMFASVRAIREKYVYSKNVDVPQLDPTYVRGVFSFASCD